MSKLRVRPTAGYRPQLNQDELDAIEAGIPDGYYVTVLVHRRPGLGFAAKLYREDDPNVIAAMPTREASLADDIAWLVKTYARERAA